MATSGLLAAETAKTAMPPPEGDTKVPPPAATDKATPRHRHAVILEDDFSRQWQRGAAGAWVSYAKGSECDALPAFMALLQAFNERHRLAAPRDRVTCGASPSGVSS